MYIDMKLVRESVEDTLKPKSQEEINKDIEDLNFSVRSFNCLRRYGIVSVGDLIQKTEEEIMNLRNFGKKSLDEIKLKLAEYNLVLKQTED
jgi:DNA-directed RNA polymerase subunit alpha